MFAAEPGRRPFLTQTDHRKRKPERQSAEIGDSDGKLQMGIIVTRGRWIPTSAAGCSTLLLLPRLTAGSAVPAQAQASAHASAHRATIGPAGERCTAGPKGASQLSGGPKDLGKSIEPSASPMTSS